MFVRKKKNRSGSVSVAVVDKSRGRFREIRQFGVAHTEAEVNALVLQANDWIHRYAGQRLIDFEGESVSQESDIDLFVSRIDSASINGPYMLLSQVYDLVGFNLIKDEILRHLVIARICQPASKLATTAYLRSYYKEDVHLSRIYRYMDKLYNRQMERVQEISITHTRQILGGSIGLLFYDVTTLYFETAPKDDMRQAGFSKDGKTSEAQVVLGLLVSQDGYPLSYSIFNGSQYEGYKRGYNKFLEISKDVQVRINPKKIAEDERWDGLKGYVTNTNLTADEVITQYHGLWVVERAFRISKGNLEMRPMFHFTERRIEAHVCICFVAYKVYKELERIVKLSGIGLSVDKVIEIAKTIISIDIKTDGVKGTARRTLFLTEEQKMIQPLFDIEKLVGHFG